MKKRSQFPVRTQSPQETRHPWFAALVLRARVVTGVAVVARFARDPLACGPLPRTVPARPGNACAAHGQSATQADWTSPWWRIPRQQPSRDRHQRTPEGKHDMGVLFLPSRRRTGQRQLQGLRWRAADGMVWEKCQAPEKP